MANNKQRYVNTKYWNDSYIAELKPLEKLLFIYLLTNGHTNISGVYEVPMKIIAIETGLDAEELQATFSRLEDKVRYIDGYVIVKNFVRHQEIKSPKVIKGIENCLKDVDIELLKHFVKQGYYVIPKEIADTLSIPYVYSSNYLDSNLDLDSDLNSISDEEIRPSSDVKKFIDFFYKATEKVRGIKPIIDGAKDGKLTKDRLKVTKLDDLEQLTVWYLTRKKRVKNSRGVWMDEYKNPPAIATMLSTSYFNQLISDQKNARDFMRENLEWINTLYSQKSDFDSMVASLLA